MKRVLAAGTPRSGTTLLQQILMAHPRGTSISETHFFEEAPDDDLIFNPETTGESLYEALKEETHVQVLTKILNPEELETLRDQSTNRIDLFIRILDHYAQTEDADYWVEKTPTHLMEFPRIFGQIDDLKGLIIVRDPRDTCSSLLDKPWTHDDIESNAKRWLGDNVLAGMLAEECPERIALVRYHELVTEPRAVITDICDHLEIEFHENMLHPEEHAEELTFRWEEWKDNNYRPINDSAIGKYKKKLSDEQVNTVVSLTAPVSNELLGTDFTVLPVAEEIYEATRDQFRDRVESMKTR
jgi:hypothetical protein